LFVRVFLIHKMHCTIYSPWFHFSYNIWWIGGNKLWSFSIIEFSSISCNFLSLLGSDILPPPENIQLHSGLSRDDVDIFH
jgi:hypothetical protein